MSRDGAVPEEEHDQDADPPTPDGQEPDRAAGVPGSEPGSDPDPEPGFAAGAADGAPGGGG